VPNLSQSTTAVRKGEAGGSPGVSLVLPCHNAESWLTETLDSVAAQDYPRLQVVFVDDGSTDRSSAIAEGYRDRLPGLVVERQRNQGVSAARNRGLELAEGDYLCFLDADDLLPPSSIARRVRFLESGDFAVCGGIAAIVDAAGESLNMTVGRREDTALAHAFEVPFHISTLMGRIEVMRGSRFALDRKYSEDWQYQVDLLRAGWKIGACGGDPLACYRWHEAAATAKEVLPHMSALIAHLDGLLALQGPAGASGASPIDRERLERAKVTRVQNIFVYFSLGPREREVERTIVGSMDAVTRHWQRSLAHDVFENVATRRLLLPKGSVALHRAVVAQMTNVRAFLDGLAPSPANTAFALAYEQYILRLIDGLRTDGEAVDYDRALYRRMRRRALLPQAKRKIAALRKRLKGAVLRR